MEHISETMERAFDSWRYYRNRWAFYRKYYPEYAEQWIAEDRTDSAKNVTIGRQDDEKGV